MSVVDELGERGIDAAVITRDGKIKEQSDKFDDVVVALSTSIVNRMAVIFEQIKDSMEEIIIETASRKIMLVPFEKEFLIAFVKTEQDKKIVREAIGANVH
ncbi:MAG: hypothetical protein ACPL06_04550 [Candidatus Anstonellales archaeon]